MIKDGQGNLFSRKSLVLAVANKDGSAHVDPELGSAYAALARSNSLGWIFMSGGVESPFLSPVPASIRQIAYELEQTVREQGPALLGIDAL